MLFGAVTLSCRLDGLAVDLPPVQQQVDWVRTAQGWEHSSTWASTETPPVSLQPLVVAAGQAMLSILALAFYAEEGKKSPAVRSGHPLVASSS